MTDEQGIFRMNLEAGLHNFIISHVGFAPVDTIVHIESDTTIVFSLLTADVPLDEIMVVASGSGALSSDAGMGTFLITRKEIAKIPSLLGEADPLGLIRLTPGVQSGSEGNVGFHVRGGGADQNLILYNNAQVYNPGHLLGFFSVFNPDIVKDVTIIKSGIPARYGGKLSSVIEVRSYKGNRDSVEVMGSVGFVASRLAISLPLFGKKGALIVGARRTYLDFIVLPVITTFTDNNFFISKDNSYYFYDFNGGISFDVSDRDNLSLSAYSGRDNYAMLQKDIDQNTELRWGNSMGSFQWDHAFGKKNTLKVNFSWTRYLFDISGSQSDYLFAMFSSVEDLSLKSELHFRKGNHSMIAGLEFSEHSFIPNKINATASEFNLNIGQFSPMAALEGGIFVDDEFPLTPRLSLAAGIRLSFFSHHGPYQEYVRDQFEQVTDTLFYSWNKSLAFYLNPEPRFVLKYQAGSNSSVEASYMRVAQYVHLATSSSVSLPTDIWIPSTSTIKPMIGDQISIGYFRNIPGNEFELSAELYYKRMNNKLEFLRGIVYNSIYGTLEENIATGFARSYGMELLFRKKKGNLTGWISYTLSRTEQKFEELNQGLFYPAKYDRRHDIAVTMNYRFNEKWDGSAVFIFTSGNAFTMPVGRYIIQGDIVNQYGEVNQFRMPPYHRLDLSVTRKLTIKKKWFSELNLSVFNVYNRANPYFIYFKATGELENYSLEIKPQLVTLFPVIPSLSWNFIF